MPDCRASRAFAFTLVSALGAVFLTDGGAPAPAHAQSTASADQPREAITVTARRREEALQSTPVAVTAIAPGQLAAQAAQDLTDIEGLTPNLIIDPVGAGPGGAGISIRGISFEDIEKSFDPAVGVLIDGVYIGTNTAQLLNVFDFEQIEVLRGPQGTLFGRNTTAGVINVRRTRPTGEFGFKGEATFGEFGRQDFQTVLNFPIGDSDVAAGKLFYFSQETDGFINNVTLGRTVGIRDYQNFGGTLSLDLANVLDLVVTGEGFTDDGETATSPLSVTGLDAICAVPGAPGFSPAVECNRNNGDDLYTAFFNEPGTYNFDQQAVTAEANLDLGEYTLTSVTGWRQSDEDVIQDFDSSSVDFFDTRRIQDYEQISEELRLSGPLFGEGDFVFGFYYFSSEYQLNQTTNFGAVLQAPPGNLPPSQIQSVDHESTSLAVFADVIWPVTDDIGLNVGGRFTYDDKEIRNSLFVPSVPVTAFDVTASDSWSEFTPKVTIDYQATDDILTYFTYSRGFRSGGFNGRALTAASTLQPYEPEIVDSFEVGVKTTWLNGLATLNVAGFYSDYSDKQEEIVRPAPGVGQETIVDNAAAATIMGLEVEGSFAITDELTIQGSLGLLDAEYDEFGLTFPAVVDASSRELRRTPDVTGSVVLNYLRPFGPGEIRANASYRYTDSYATTISGDPLDPTRNDPRGNTDTQNNLSATIGYAYEYDDGREFRVSAFGRNILDDRGLSSALPVAGLFTFGAPRPPQEFGVQVGLNF